MVAKSCLFRRRSRTKKRRRVVAVRGKCLFLTSPAEVLSRFWAHLPACANKTSSHASNRQYFFIACVTKKVQESLQIFLYICKSYRCSVIALLFARDKELGIRRKRRVREAVGPEELVQQVFVNEMFWETSSIYNQGGIPCLVYNADRAFTKLLRARVLA